MTDQPIEIGTNIMTNFQVWALDVVAYDEDQYVVNNKTKLTMLQFDPLISDMELVDLLVANRLLSNDTDIQVEGDIDFIEVKRKNYPLYYLTAYSITTQELCCILQQTGDETLRAIYLSNDGLLELWERMPVHNPVNYRNQLIKTTVTNLFEDGLTYKSDSVIKITEKHFLDLARKDEYLHMPLAQYAGSEVLDPIVGMRLKRPTDSIYEYQSTFAKNSLLELLQGHCDVNPELLRHVVGMEYETALEYEEYKNRLAVLCLRHNKLCKHIVFDRLHNVWLVVDDDEVMEEFKSLSKTIKKLWS